MLWVDKHRPRNLEKLVVHEKQGKHLKKLVSAGDCPHLLFYGPSGSGKKTLALATLREIFGPGAEKLKTEHRTWQIKLPSRKVEVELATVSSNYHLELNPSEAGRKDVYVVQEVIKEMAKTKSSTSVFQESAQVNAISSQGGGGNAAGEGGGGGEKDKSQARQKCTYKVLLINEVDRLTRHAQHALRRTMEKYSKQCRLVMTCSNLSKVIDPVQSRCVCVRVKSPREEEMKALVHQVAKKEHLTLPDALALRIAKESKRSIRRALLMLETCRVDRYPFNENQEIQVPEWELFIKDIAKDILKEQTPKMLFQVRGKLYELLINCVPVDVVFKHLARELMCKLDDDLKYETIKAAAHFEHRLQLGSKAIFHLEAFVAKFMSIYKQFLSSVY
mmetsp:Transcript_42/g.102  ORF Transcript_42/g.102 Transcript_42/m.102 type:complete len:389 (+) Transcript_42:107-1273(+)